MSPASSSSSSSSSSTQRLSKVLSHLQESSPAGELPAIPQVAPDSLGPRLAGKVAIITGCNSALGLGRATAHQFARHGLRALYVCDYASDRLGALQAELGRAGAGAVRVHARAFDAADEGAVEAVVADALERYGRLDVFFANAGVQLGVKMVGELGMAQFLETMRVNAGSVFLAVKHASKAMMKTSADKPRSGGSIIATASTAGIRSGAGATDYSASKAAVINIMQTSAYQLVGTSIRCNAICPGIIETGMTAPVYEAARARGTAHRIGQINPLRRGGVADEVARVALFLASDESSYVNAQFWAVDGGLSGSHPTAPGKIH